MLRFGWKCVYTNFSVPLLVFIFDFSAQQSTECQTTDSFYSSLFCYWEYFMDLPTEFRTKFRRRRLNDMQSNWIVPSHMEIVRSFFSFLILFLSVKMHMSAEGDVGIFLCLNFTIISTKKKINYLIFDFSLQMK